MLVNRVYLHMIMHGVFRHLLKPAREDRVLWNVSCDIAVEALIDGMHHRSIRMGVHPFRKVLYSELQDKLKVLTAEGIYRVLQAKELSQGQLARFGEAPVLLPGKIWIPEGNACIVLQISHGMTEHIGRYEKVGEMLTKHGIVVAGFDLRGHGCNEGDPTCASFGEGGWEASIQDMHLF